MKRQSLFAALVATTLMLLPSIALACPVCAADNGKGTLKILVVFLTVPFVIAIVVIPAIVRAVRQAGP